MNPAAPLLTVMAIAGDPGGAAALAPVIQELREDARMRILTCPYNEALTLWQARGIETNLHAQATIAEFQTLMRLEQVDYVIAGTSVNARNLEQLAIMAASELQLPTLAVLDYWANYRQRFSSTGKVLDVLPNWIAVMDGQARDEMIAEGFPAEILCITGQPAFDSLAADRLRMGPAACRQLRQTCGVADGEVMVFFPSQPISIVCGEDASNPLYLGYTEREVAALLIAALDQIASERGVAITLVTKPHPREDGGWLLGLTGKQVTVRAAPAVGSRDLCIAADLVVGMDSVLLVEACYLGSNVLSVQPNLVGPDTVPTNRMGASAAVYRADEVKPAIERALYDAPAREVRAFRLASLTEARFNAAAAVARLIRATSSLRP
jgi:hypothetical protein